MITTRDHLLSSFKEILLESGKQQDSYSLVWLVGMSTVSNIAMPTDFSGWEIEFRSISYSKMECGFLTGTIVLGLLFRIFHIGLSARLVERSDMSFYWYLGYSGFMALTF